MSQNAHPACSMICYQASLSDKQSPCLSFEEHGLLLILLCAWRDTRTDVYLRRKRPCNACLICSTQVDPFNEKHLKSANVMPKSIVAIWLERTLWFWGVRL